MPLVLLEHPSPRATWAVEHVLGRILGLPVRITTDRSAFASAGGARLSYGAEPVAGALHVPWTGALERPPLGDPPLGEVRGMPVLFPATGGHDLFAAVLFLLALVDEQRCTARDAHGRVPSSQLFTVRSGLHQRPWVDLWALDLAERLRAHAPGIAIARRTYHHQLTVDVDNVLRYAGRPWHRAMGASVRDLAALRPRGAMQRWSVRMGGAPDPYIRAFERLQRHTEGGAAPVLFLLLRGDGPHDHAVPPGQWPHQLAPTLRGDTGIRIGWHPSYATSTDEDRFLSELALFDREVRPRTRISRQHFLRWRLPHTLRRLSEAGFEEEHSLGFPDRHGFRAATCTPYPWYDVERETATRLMLWPFAAMDSALVERMGMDAPAVERTMNALSDEVRAVGGTFVSVWHDRYLSGHGPFAPWPAVFERVMQHARP